MPYEPPKGDPPPTTESPGGTTGDTTSSSSEPAVDPVIAQKMSLFRSSYIALWGEPPTEAYLKSAATSGLNLAEFTLQEKLKPAYLTTKSFRDGFGSRRDMLAQAGVV